MNLTLTNPSVLLKTTPSWLRTTIPNSELGFELTTITDPICLSRKTLIHNQLHQQSKFNFPCMIFNEGQTCPNGLVSKGLGCESP